MLAARGIVMRYGPRTAVDGVDLDLRPGEILGLLGRRSKGQRQRVALAGAIVHGPDVLLLDEPSEGLDPRQMVGLRTLLADLKKKSSIVFSTHLLAEAQAVCDRVVVIDGGRIVLDRPAGTAASADRLRVDVGGAPAAGVRAAPLAAPGGTEGAGEVGAVAGPG